MPACATTGGSVRHHRPRECLTKPVGHSKRPDTAQRRRRPGPCLTKPAPETQQTHVVASPSARQSNHGSRSQAQGRSTMHRPATGMPHVQCTGPASGPGLLVPSDPTGDARAARCPAPARRSLTSLRPSGAATAASQRWPVRGGAHGPSGPRYPRMARAAGPAFAPGPCLSTRPPISATRPPISATDGSD